MFKIYSQKGQTLIEALVALTASVLVISAITVAVVAALNNTEYSKNQNTATQYAQQGIEAVRQISYSNWGLFSSLVPGSVNNFVTYCLGQDAKVPQPSNSGSGSTPCGQNIGIYSRQIDIYSSNTKCANSILVSVTVSWGDGKCTNSVNPFCHNVSLDSCFTENSSSQLAP